MGVEPALEDEGGGEPINQMAAGMAVAGVVAGGFERGVGLGGGEAFVPEMNGQGRVFYRRGIVG